jgi:hypothetical protein
MKPPKFGGPSTVARKMKRPVETTKIKELARASDSTSPGSFHRDYLPSRMEDAPLVHVPANGKYLSFDRTIFGGGKQ